MSREPTFIHRDFSASTTRHYNEIWNWYLNNLINGEFENITNNKVFRNELNEVVDSVDGDIKIMITVPNFLNNEALIRELLTKFFNANGDHEQDDNRLEICLTNFGPLKGSGSSIIMAATHTHIPEDATFGDIANYNQTIELNSVISGESDYIPSINSEDKIPTPVEIDENESSIDSFHPSVSLPPSPKYSLTRVSTIQNDEGIDELDQGSSTHVPNTPNNLSNEQQPIVQIESKESGEEEEEEEEGENYDEENKGELEEHDIDSIYSDESSIDSVEYVPSTITTHSGQLNMRYKMVLNTILFKDDEQNKRTAIRQNDEDGISDDWLLYDEDFRMDNIELFDLRDIIEMMKYEHKILFYDVILEKTNNQDDEFDDDELNEGDDLNVVEFNGNSNYHEHEGQSIKFVQSNQTTIQASENLSKTNTIKTHLGSIRSEYNLYKPDSLFSKIERSKSTPTNSKMKKLKLRNGNGDRNCIIM
ncbi:hypothetical protein BN7_5383 [Wickerhamomyces ciferrii]|uniref:Uncharacterized protein n=1 Tax=Wickerhamomyces ciferrii (strain ATCC 14091 / BCRC 22168 / CBS 111 / JCM 3599 / NBRC 0793 / NRRL Y-1031 F-60-10) TaxID=1206466 RepID=K0KV78_WICCF|nr:uncharacterized protein BN7_5383 [Wickerhamomyces ciferrii]CCH45797.1 hypothetical protein BN7_5383 [Wickerhamomyces ciferrii]